MSRQWMYVARRSDEFITGLRYFLRVAEENKEECFMCCLSESEGLLSHDNPSHPPASVQFHA